MKPRVIGILLLGFFWLTFSSTAFAVGNIHWGSLELHPYLDFSQTYESNIYKVPSGATSDNITRVGPGFDAILPFHTNEFKFGYQADVNYYWQTSANRYLGHNLYAQGAFSFLDSYLLKARDDLTFTFETTTPDLPEKTGRKRNDALIDLRYSKNLLGFRLAYENILDDYYLYPDLDKTQGIVTLSGGYLIMPKTTFFGEYRYGSISYDIKSPKRDGQYHQLELGFNGKLFAKVTGEAKAGFQRRTYADSSLKNFNGLVVSLDLKAEFSDKTTLAMLGRMGVEESVYANNNYYQLNGFDLGLEQDLGQKFNLLLGGGLEINAYPVATTEGSTTACRNDNILSLKAGVGYQIQDWLKTGVNYEYRSRNSNLDPFDYQDNIFKLTFSAEL